jgi:hypothetical protein
MKTIHWGMVWMFVGLLMTVIEGYTLGLNNSAATLSANMRMVRFDPIGRFILLPLWCWLTLHWIMAPQWLGVRPDWRSLVALGVGLAWAIVETVR